MSPFSFTSVCPSLSSYHPVVDAIAVIVPLSSCVDLPLYIFISPLLALTFSPQSVGMWAHNSACVCFRGGAFSLLLCVSCLHTWKQLGNHSPAFNLMITHPLLKAEDFSQSNCCCHFGSKVELLLLCGCFCEKICFSSLQMPLAMANLWREIHAGKGNLRRKICRKSKLWRDTP